MRSHRGLRGATGVLRNRAEADPAGRGLIVLPFSPCGRRCPRYEVSWADEGSLSAETDPSPGCDASHRSHPLPQGERGRSAPTDLPVGLFCEPPVQSRSQKYFASPFGRNSFIFRRPVPTEGRCATSSTWGGMRWTRIAPLTNGARCGRRSRVVLTPRCWRQVREKQAPQGRRWQESRSPRRARRKPLKPLRGECRVNSGVT